MLVRSLLTLVVLVGSVGLYACGDDAKGDCIARCQEAQSRQCTSITNCNKTCTDAVTLSNQAGCGSQADSYISCLNSGDVCDTDARCASPENALTACVTPYCFTHVAECAAVFN